MEVHHAVDEEGCNVRSCGHVTARVGKTPRDVGYFNWMGKKDPLAGWKSLPLDYFSSPAVVEQERTAEAVTAMQLFPGKVLSPVVLVHIENAWHRNGPPEVHLQAIHVIQKISSD